jgi:hypothetical protein
MQTNIQQNSGIANNIESTTGSIRGTGSELASQGIKIGGVQVDAVGYSVLAKYGIIKVVGKAEKQQGKKGRVGSIYEIPAELTFFKK